MMATLFLKWGEDNDAVGKKRAIAYAAFGKVFETMQAQGSVDTADAETTEEWIALPGTWAGIGERCMSAELYLYAAMFFERAVDCCIEVSRANARAKFQIHHTTTRTKAMRMMGEVEEEEEIHIGKLKQIEANAQSQRALLALDDVFGAGGSEDNVSNVSQRIVEGIDEDVDSGEDSDEVTVRRRALTVDESSTEASSLNTIELEEDPKDKLRRGRISYMLGKSLLRVGDDDKAKDFLREAAACGVTSKLNSGMSTFFALSVDHEDFDDAHEDHEDISYASGNSISTLKNRSRLNSDGGEEDEEAFFGLKKTRSFEKDMSKSVETILATFGGIFTREPSLLTDELGSASLLTDSVVSEKDGVIDEAMERGSTLLNLLANEAEGEGGGEDEGAGGEEKKKEDEEGDVAAGSTLLNLLVDEADSEAKEQRKEGTMESLHVGEAQKEPAALENLLVGEAETEPEALQKLLVGEAEAYPEAEPFSIATPPKIKKLADSDPAKSDFKGTLSMFTTAESAPPAAPVMVAKQASLSDMKSLMMRTLHSASDRSLVGSFGLDGDGSSAGGSFVDEDSFTKTSVESFEQTLQNFASRKIKKKKKKPSARPASPVEMVSFPSAENIPVIPAFGSKPSPTADVPAATYSTSTVFADANSAISGDGDSASAVTSQPSTSPRVSPRTSKAAAKLDSQLKFDPASASIVSEMSAKPSVWITMRKNIRYVRERSNPLAPAHANRRTYVALARAAAREYYRGELCENPRDVAMIIRMGYLCVDSSSNPNPGTTKVAAVLLQKAANFGHDGDGRFWATLASEHLKVCKRA
jgi:hypothetical protein